MSDKSAPAAELAWFKSSYSNSEPDSSCVEVAAATCAVHVRDSKAADGPQLKLSSGAWGEFVAYVARS
ncbi:MULTISPECIES: DUF397 domain-containing protein [Streptomyces]|uniref:DUF397 domain-containing protein n=1 Tax=Streptomyces TaxID=1883 RepID=UPI0022495AA3|nr:DUF397 domain-containing protein [Streptomyces sp. JHD 1]MCX2971067.1 DUF397 domain-containing protein [Streptomyces sp. JHD 1]